MNHHRATCVWSGSRENRIAPPQTCAGAFIRFCSRSRVKAPKAGAEDKYEKIFGEFRFAEIELIAVFHLPGSGKIPDKVCELADVWLRRAVKQGTQRCVLALSFPNYQEEKLRELLRKLKLRK